MTAAHQPVVSQYQRALDEFRSAGEASPLLKRMSELVSLLDLTTTLNSGLARDQVLDGALLVVMGDLQATRGCLLVRSCRTMGQTTSRPSATSAASWTPSRRRTTVSSSMRATSRRDGAPASRPRAATTS